MAPTRSWDEYLAGRLREHPEEIPEYLSDCLADDEPGAFLVALKHVIDALGVRPGGHKARPNRASVGQMLSRRGNPRLRNLQALLDEMDLRLVVQPHPGKRGSAGRDDR